MAVGENAFLGTWKLRSFVREDVETGNKSYPLGTSPTCYLNYSSDGRMMVILVGDNRKTPAGPVATDAEMIALARLLFERGETKPAVFDFSPSTQRLDDVAERRASLGRPEAS